MRPALRDGGNGVYKYGAAARFPTETFGTARTTGSTPSSSATHPPDTRAAARSAHAQPGRRRRPASPPNSKVKVTFDEAIDPLTVNTGAFLLADGAGNAGAGAGRLRRADPHRHADADGAARATARPTRPRVKSGNAGVDRPGRQPARRRHDVDVLHAGRSARARIFDRHRPTPARQRRPGPAARGRREVPRRPRTASSPRLRFYKQANNTGTHVGHLWTADGPAAGHRHLHRTRRPTGWQQVDLPNPIPVTKDTTYVSSYYSPQRLLRARRRAASTARITRAPLIGAGQRPTAATASTSTAPAAFPTDSCNATNYWVDASFDRTIPPDTRGPAVVTRRPRRRRAIDVAAHGDRRGRVRRAARRRRRVTATTFTLRDAAGRRRRRRPSSYDAQTRTAKLDPDRAAGLSRRRTRRRSRAAPAASRTSPATRWPPTRPGRSPSPASRRPRARAARSCVRHRPGRPVRHLLRRDPARRGPERVRDRRRPGHGRDARPARRPSILASPTRHRRRGHGAHELGPGRRQPDRDAARQEAAPGCSASPTPAARCANGYMKVDTGSAAGAGIDGADAAVPRHRRPLHAQRRERRSRRCTRTPTHGDDEPGRDAARRRRRRRPGRGVHLRPRALGRLHAPGQPGVGGRQARRHRADSSIRPNDLFYGAKAGDVAARLGRPGPASTCRRPTSSSACWRT